MRRASDSDLLPAVCRDRDVLTLDVAGMTGWARPTAEQLLHWPMSRPFAGSVLVPPEPRPPIAFGTVATARRGSGHGERAAILDEWLEASCERGRPGLVVAEQPIPPMHSRNMKATQVTLGLLMIVKAFCARHGIEYREEPIVSIKAWFGSKQQRDKSPMIATARALGWQVANDHEADACAIADLVIARARMAARNRRLRAA